MHLRELCTLNTFSKLDIRFRNSKLLPRTIPTHTIQRFLNTLYSQKEQSATEYQCNCCIREIAVIELLFATGMRISQLCTLRPENIDFTNNTILIYGKGCKERILQIGTPNVSAALSLYKEIFQKDIKICGYFFVNRLQHRLSVQSVRYIINHYANPAGIVNNILLRICFATLLQPFCWNKM